MDPLPQAGARTLNHEFYTQIFAVYGWFFTSLFFDNKRQRAYSGFIEEENGLLRFGQANEMSWPFFLGHTVGKMKIIKTAAATAAAGAVAFLAAGANAGSLEPPGWTAGIALGAALPEGAYFIDTATVGGWRGIDTNKASLGINVPLIAWSTPWTLPGGGRVEVLAAAPEITGGVPALGTTWSGRDYTEFYNPAGFAGAAWDLGGGFGFSAFIGGWAPVDNQLRLFGFDSWVLSERANLSYVANGWKLAANLSFGQPGHSEVPTAFNAAGYKGSQILPSYFNYDLTATKTIGKWEIGLVGFGSADTSKDAWNNALYGAGKQSQFALGGLVGYSFTGITLQTYLTRDVVSNNYYNVTDGSRSYDTRIWTRAIVPLWNPPALESYK